MTAGLRALWFALALLLPGLARAEPAYPDHPIHLVVPFAPGGNVDVVARVVAQALGDVLKQPVVVNNKPGANAMIGAQFVAHAAGDGYTLLLASAETQAINPHIHAKIDYDPLKDFVPIGVVDRFAFSIVTNPKLAARTLAQFVALARARPGRMTFASWGVGSTSQIAFAQFERTAGIDLLHVPYNGAAPAIAAVSSGQVDALIVPLSVAVPQARGGQVGLLGVTSERRAPSAPDVPTFVEQGFPVVIGGWHVIVAPAATPRAVVERLNAALREVLATADVRARLEQLGVTPAPGSVDDADRLIRSEYERWGKAARDAKITVD